MSLAGRFALIVAEDQYRDPKLRQLRAPSNDARELEEILANSSIGGFEVKLALNSSAQAIREEVERFFVSRAPEDLLLLYFACHGVKDQRGRLYLAMSDTNLGLLASTGVSSNFVNEQLEACRSRRIVLILDCCYSGAYARGLAPRGDTRVGVCESFEGDGRVVLTASDALEYAFEEEELRTNKAHSSIFTGAIIRGLRTGDADIDQDGLVSVDELYDFVYSEVRAQTPNQTPGRVSLVRGSIYLAANPRIKPSRISPHTDPFLAAVSEHRWEREEAALELRRLTEDPDATIAHAAQAALEQLADDRERLVQASAEAALGDVTKSHFERGLVFASVGDHVGAEAEFRKVAPDSSATKLGGFAYFNLATLASCVNNLDEAMQHYTAALASGPPVVAARAALNLGCLHEEAGQQKRAMALYEEAMTYNDSAVKPRAAFLLGRLNEEKGDMSRAWQNYAVATDYDGHPFVAEAKSRYQALIRFVTGSDLIERALSLSGYLDPAAFARAF